MTSSLFLGFKGALGLNLSRENGISSFLKCHINLSFTHIPQVLFLTLLRVILTYLIFVTTTLRLDVFKIYDFLFYLRISE